MNPILRNRQTVSYALAVALTLITFWLAVGDGAHLFGESRDVIWAQALVIAGIKVRLVLLDFMDLRSAPWGLRLSFEAFFGGIVLALILINALS